MTHLSASDSSGNGNSHSRWTPLMCRRSPWRACSFRLRNARNASDCVWMETGLKLDLHHCTSKTDLRMSISVGNDLNQMSYRSYFNSIFVIYKLDLKLKSVNLYWFTTDFLMILIYENHKLINMSSAERPVCAMPKSTSLNSVENNYIPVIY